MDINTIYDRIANGQNSFCEALNSIFFPNELVKTFRIIASLPKEKKDELFYERIMQDLYAATVGDTNHEYISTPDMPRFGQCAMNCLHIAAALGHINLVRKLFGIFDPDDCFDFDNWGILHYACFSQDTEIYNLCINELKINIDEQSTHGITPLMLAALHGSVEMVEWLITNGANHSHLTFNRYNIFYFSATNFEVTKFLIEQYGKDPHVQFGHSSSLLSEAIETDSIDVIKYLFNLYPELLYATCGEYSTPFMMSLYNSKFSICDLCIQHGYNEDNHIGEEVYSLIPRTSSPINTLYYIMSIGWTLFPAGRTTNILTSSIEHMNIYSTEAICEILPIDWSISINGMSYLDIADQYSDAEHYNYINSFIV